MSSTTEVKVFKMNDCDWVAATDLESAKKFYLEFTGNTTQDFSFEDERELTAAEMQRLRFRDEDIDDGTTVTRSFAEQLEHLVDCGIEFPCFFASTEF